jgi:Inositol 1,3,4-trisphosphate 5/6-kinase ATP-grasp domain
LLEEEQGLSTPLIVKPLIAAGTKESHCMLIALQNTAFVKLPPKTIVQEFINHNAKLYKVYVLGDFVSVYERHSLPNLPEDLSKATVDLVEFDSQRPYPTLSDFGFDTDYQDNNTKTDSKVCSHVAMTDEEVMPVVKALKKAFGLELFGFDILRRPDDKEWLVVDVNYFPSYKEVPNFPSLLARYLTKRVLEQRRKSSDAG